MFFKKKIALRDFCRQKLDFILSDEGKALADDCRKQCGADFVSNSDADQYLAHFRGAFLQLLGVAFSRTLKRDQRYDVMSFEKEYLNSNGMGELEDIHRLYNSAFGSSFVDGVEQMALCLAEQFQTSGVDATSIARVHYDGFYNVLRELFDEIKKVKLV